MRSQFSSSPQHFHRFDPYVFNTPAIVGKSWEYFSKTYTVCNCIVQEQCESRGGRPGLSVLTSLLVSVDVKQY